MYITNGTEKYCTILKILIRFVVAVYQKNNSKSATEKYEFPLIEINRYLSLQIQPYKKKNFKLPDIPDNFMNPRKPQIGSW